MKIAKTMRHSLAYLLIFALLSFVLIYFLDVQEAQHGWRKDLSFNAYATTGEETQRILSSLNREVYLYTFYTQANKDEYLSTLLESYSRLNSFIKTENISLAENPHFLSKLTAANQQELKQDSLLAYSPATKRYKILAPTDMLSLSYNIQTGKYDFSDLRYEKSISEAILYVNSDQIPKVYILTGHGETPTAQMEALLSYVQLNGYDISFVQQVPSDMEGDALLLINSLKKDLSEQELEHIQTFEKKGGSILATFQYDDPADLPNYKNLLDSYGIEVLKGRVTADKKDTASYYQQPSYLIPYMEPLEMLSGLISSNKDLLLMPLPKAFSLKESNTYHNTALLHSGESAQRLDNENDALLSSGKMTLAAYSEKQLSNSAHPKLAVIGSTLSITDEYIYSISFASEFVQTLLNKLLPQKIVQTNIALKPAFRPNLMPSSKNVGVAIIILLPVCILLIGIAVIRHRRSL